MLLPPENFSEKVFEEKFGRQSEFHPMCCLTTTFIDEGYTMDDLINLYKDLVR